MERVSLPPHLHVFPDFAEEEEACSDKETALSARNLATPHKFVGFNHSCKQDDFAAY